MKFLFVLAGITLSFFLNGCASLAQRTILPGSFLKAPDSIVSPPAGCELVSLSINDGSKIVALFGSALNKSGQSLTGNNGRPTVIFCYGNRMCIAQSRDIFEDFRRMGVNVLIPEYPGYGMSGGTASERGCYAASDAAYEYLMRRTDIDHRQIIIAGMSLGAGVAADQASREQVAGLILVVPFANISSVGKDNLAWYLRWTTPLLAPHATFDNLAKIPRVTCPILLIQAKRDQITSAQRSDEIASAAKSTLFRVVVDSDHDGSWKAGRKEIEDWLGTVFGSTQPGW
jgi:hypothetical protein